MSIQVQNYLVYCIVLFALGKLILPFLINLFITLKDKVYGNNNKIDDSYSCYTGTCGRCKLK
jgi:hypothetical protein